MMSFRPETGSRYLDRLRLLSLLPEKPGFVVWLEAPYGYGKSVLASQWAATLENDDWRLVWLAADSSDVRRTVAAGLSLPADSPWEAVLETLWVQPTVLVLEDLENLENHEELVPLLRDSRGLVLLASRGPLTSSEIPRLITSGRLIHLQSDDLEFTEQEARDLIPDARTSQQVWQQAGGWPLPLHFAALTGKLPDGQQLLSGMRASLNEAEWQEVLVLATLPDLPADAATEITVRLAGSGFVQFGATGYRLHALAAEHILASHAAEASSALKQAAGRLPRLLYGEALERLGELPALAELLDMPQPQLSRKSPEAVLRWDGLVPGPVTALRHVAAAMANAILGRHEQAVSRFQTGLAEGGLDSADELLALKGLVWSLALTDHAAAEEVIQRAEELIPRVDPEIAGRFLSDSSFVDAVVGNFAAAIRKLERALQYLPADSSFRTGCHINLALNRWDSLGDYDGRLAAQTSTLEDVWRLYPSDAPGQCRDIAMMHVWAGNHVTARKYLEEAISGERANPVVGLEVRAALAALDGDAPAFPELLSRARIWNSQHTLDLIGMYAIQTSPAEAQYYYDQVPERVLTTAAYARLLPDKAEAVRLIDAVLEGQEDRAFLLYLRAARYSVTRSSDDLDAFLAVSNAAARLLPGFVPLAELPADRPELANHYAIESVIAAGWKDAIRLRSAELPNLHIDILGQLRVHFAGRTLELSERPMLLLVMLLLGFSREEAADAIWPEAETAQQRNNLNVQLSALRKVLEPWGTGHFLHEDSLEHVQSDYLRLIAALDDEDYDTALQLYREPLAPGVGLEQLADHRAWLRGRVLESFQSAEQSRRSDAARFLVRILDLDPLNEHALRELLKHLLQRGRQREAQRHYEEFAARLWNDTGLEPDASTKALVPGS